MANSYSDNESGGKQKVSKKKIKNKSAKGKQKARFVVARPKKSITGDRDGDWTDSEDEEDRRLQRIQDPKWSHVPSRFPALGTSTDPNEIADSTNYAILSLAENAAALGLFQ